MTHANAPLSVEGRRQLIERCRTRPIAHVVERFDLDAEPEVGAALLRAAHDALGGPGLYYAARPAHWRRRPEVLAVVKAMAGDRRQPPGTWVVAVAIPPAIGPGKPSRPPPDPPASEHASRHARADDQGFDQRRIASTKSAPRRAQTVRSSWWCTYRPRLLTVVSPACLSTARWRRPRAR